MIRPAICLNEHKDYGRPMRDFSVINWLIWADLGRATEQVERYLGSTVVFDLSKVLVRATILFN